MDAEAVRKVLRVLFEDAKVPSVSFTGGEPTLVPELADHIRFAKELGMRVNLITNGTLIDSMFAASLAEAGLDSAQVSLEGVSAAVHDRSVGQAGAFTRTLDAVTHLKGAGIHTHTNTTITRSNLEDCRQMPVFVASQLGCDRFSMNLIIPTGSAAQTDGHVLRYEDTGSVLRDIIRESRACGVEFMWYSPIPMCMFNSITHGLGNKGCSACDGLISVAANGDVLPCASFDAPVGNLLSQRFPDVWQCRQAVRFREKDLAHPRCKSCEHFDICNGACPLYWRHLGFGELERANNWGHP
jgi:radical SAM protein with 4Fe4S-binding SPASM domain